MKKFRFRLQTLLKLREQAEKDKQKAHATALGQVRTQQSQLGEIQGQSHRSTVRQQSQMTGRLSASQMLNWGRFVYKLRRDTIVGRQLLVALEKNAEEKRTDLVAASRQRRIYEKLRDRLKERHTRSVEKTLRHESDENAIDVHRRRRSSSKL